MGHSERTRLWATCAGVAAVLSAPQLTVVNSVPGRDSGLYLYVASRMLNGAVPYRDVWDHKPPLIFAIDMLGLVLGDGSVLGVWLLQVAALALAGACLFAILRDFARPLVVAWVLVATAVLLPLLGNDNVPEGFGLALQLPALLLAARGSHDDRRTWLVIGLLGGLAFTLKQTLIGEWLAIGVLLLMRRRVGSLAAFAAGSLIAPALMLGYLAATGAASDFWDAAFVFSQRYTLEGADGRVLSLWLMVLVLALSGLAPLALVGWFRAATRVRDKLPHVVVIALLGLPVELAFGAVSGRGYAHYALPCLAPLAVLAAFAAESLVARHWQPRNATIRALGLVAVVAASVWLPLVLLFDVRVPQMEASMARSAELAQAAEQVSTPGEPLLVWGAEVGVNFALHRPSPTRFAYQYGLTMPGYSRPELVDQFQRELRSEPPVALIDASGDDDNAMPLDPTTRASWLAVHDPRHELAEISGAVDGLLAGARCGYVSSSGRCLGYVLVARS